MASPYAFRSPRREAVLIGSSSPDLPPVRDLLSQTSKPPPFRSPVRTKPVATHPESTSPPRWNARNPASTPYSTVKSAYFECPDSCDSVVEIQSEVEPQHRRIDTAGPTTRADGPSDSNPFLSSPSDSQPWRKYQMTRTPTKSKEDTKVAQMTAPEHGNARGESILGEESSKTVNFAAVPEENVPKARTPKARKPEIEEPLNLEAAMARRNDWTPPAEKQVQKTDLDFDSSVENPASSADHTQSNVFQTLLEKYGCQDAGRSDVVVISGDDSESSFLKKRKLVEFITTKESVPPQPVVEKKSSKSKAPKKARTITELAMAKYQVSSECDSSLTAYPSEDASASEAKEDLVAADDKVKGEGKQKQKRKSTKTTKKKAQIPKRVLLSPNTALLQAAEQNYVFGTSSQLAREQSPTLLRDIQRAMKDSSAFDAGTADISALSDADSPCLKPKLWDAAARDVDGDLLDIQVIDLVGTSPPTCVAGGDPDPFGYSKAEMTESRAKQDGPKSTADDSFETLDDILPPRPVRRQPVEIEDSESSFSISRIPANSEVRNSKDEAVDPRMNDEATSATAVPGKKAALEPQGVIAQAPSPPKYELYTDAQLSREVASYGFKQVKRRSAMIGLLEQCWKSKNACATLSSVMVSVPTGIPAQARSASTQAKASVTTKKPRGRPRKNVDASKAEPTEPPPSAQPSESPKMPRGRQKNTVEDPKPTRSTKAKATTKKPEKESTAKVSPKKNAARPRPRPRTPERIASVPTTVVEIPDSMSEDESVASASPFSSPEPCSSPPAVDLSLSVGEDTELSLNVSADAQQEALFSKITKAIKAAPRTTDPSNPSWHEKILLYDPIVLEDLTGWLNSGQLTKAGHDHEVSPGEVKKWCESKSVCCLWRVNLRGKERKRF